MTIRIKPREQQDLRYIESRRERLKQLVNRRTLLDKAILREVSILRNLYENLSEIIPLKKRKEDIAEIHLYLKPVGLTQAIINAMRKPKLKALSPRQVTEQLEMMGFDLSIYQQPVATISTVLRRLAEKKVPQVRRISNGRRGVKYQWLIPLRPKTASVSA